MKRMFSTHLLDSTDVALMRSMLAMFGDAFEDPDAYARNPPSDAYLSGLLTGEAFLAVAAIHDGRVVGGLAGYVLRKFEQERSEFYIYDLAVAQEFRRQGVATALIHCLQAACAERGIGVIFVQADQGDDPAIELYTKLGTRQDVLHFDIPTANAAA